MAPKKYKLVTGDVATKVIDLSPQPVKSETKRKKATEAADDKDGAPAPEAVEAPAVEAEATTEA